MSNLYTDMGIGDGAPGIREFSNDIVGNGIVDDSVALKAAHDAAVAAGVRYVSIPPKMTIYAPSASQLGNVIFVGDGAITGAYRKKLVPVGTQTMEVPGGVIPAIHMRQFASTPNPVAVICGDSLVTTVPNPNNASISDTMEFYIQSKLVRDNPGKTITWYNRGVAGTNWTDLNTTPNANHPAGSITFPAWYTTPTNTWLSYIQALAPDIVFINLGTNDGAGLVITDLNGVITKLRAFPKPPSIVLITSLQRSGMYSGIVVPWDQNGRDMAAGIVRTLARRLGLGLIDAGRQSVISVDGYDQENTYSQDIISTSAQLTTAFPYTFSEAVQDFDLMLHADNTGGALFGGANAGGVNRLQIRPVGGYVSCAIQIFDYNGYLSLTVNSSINLPQINNITPTPTGLFTWRVSKKSGMLYVDVNGVQVFYGPMYAYGGIASLSNAPAPPQIYQTNGGTQAFTIMHLAYGRNRLCMPTITDGEMWSTTAATGAEGGNGINHPSTIGMAEVFGKLLDRTNLSAEPGYSTVRATLTGASYTVPANVDIVRFVQTGTIAAQTVVLPAATFDTQALQFVNYAGAITALTFSPAVPGWTNGSALAANTKVRIRWDATASSWQIE